MRKKRPILFIACALLACIFSGALAACGTSDEGYKGVEVVYELEGGKYLNTPRHVRQYYDIPEGGETLISPPGELSGQKVTRANYYITGWYRTKTENPDGTASYSDEWDFAKDRLKYGDGALTLYCGWARNVTYSYTIKGYDENGEERTIRTINVSAGDPFSDPNDAADRVEGYTAKREQNAETGKYEIVYYAGKDEGGNLIPWDETFVHPGGKESLSVPVYVELIKGDFVYVTNKDEFIKASANRDGVWLCDEIDLEGAEIYGFKDNAGVFGNKAFYGNGHTVRNFKLVYDNSANGVIGNGRYPMLENNALCISLFGFLQDSVVKDVTFEGVTVELDATFSRIGGVYVAPIAVLMTDSSVSGVSYTGTVTVVKLSDKLKEKCFVTTDSPVWQEGAVCTDCETHVTYDPS